MRDRKRPTDDQVTRFNEARANYVRMIEQEAKQKAQAVEQQRVGDLYPAAAEASIVFLAIKGHVTADLYFNEGSKMHFEAWPWGIGAAGGKGLGGYFGVSPYTLFGDCTYWCQGITAPAGVLQITFFRENIGILGQIDVAVAGIGAFEIGGSDGNWTFSERE